MTNIDRIPTEEIKQDILDTEKEILQMMKEIDGFTLIGDRMSLVRADTRKEWIRERREFINKLLFIMQSRN